MAFEVFGFSDFKKISLKFRPQKNQTCDPLKHSLVSRPLKCLTCPNGCQQMAKCLVNILASVNTRNETIIPMITPVNTEPLSSLIKRETSDDCQSLVSI